MKISAIICTHNGQKVLEKAIQSLIDQTLDKKDYEILVVDNASTDNTRNIVRQFEKEKNLKYIFEPNLGLSHARNTGWKEAEGEFVAYLDDDAIACPEWLERILDAFRTVPEAGAVGAVGGRTNPIWEAPRPVWLPDNMLESLSIINWSETPIFLNDKQWLVGANISFPRNILKELGGFSIDLGRKGNCLLSNEENLLIRKIREKGLKIFYHPQILVHHLVPANRLKKGWFIRRYFWQGISDAIFNYGSKALTIKEKFLIIKNQFHHFIKNPELIFCLLKPSDDKKVWDEKRVSYYRLGYIRGIFYLKSE